MYPPSTYFRHQLSFHHTVLSTCPNHLNTLLSTLLANSASIPALLRTSLFLTATFCDNPTNFSNTSSQDHLFSFSRHISYPISLPLNAVGTITPSYRHSQHLFQSSIALLTFHSSPRFTPLIHSVSYIFFSHPPSAATCNPRYLQQSNSSNGSPFSLTCIQPTFTYLELFIT